MKVKAVRCPICEIIFLRRILFTLARPGTQRDRSLKRPVTAPCSHHPPTLAEISMMSRWLANIKAGPARRSRDTAMVAVFRLAPSPPVNVPVLPSGRLSQPGPAARVSAATGCEGNELPEQRVRAPRASCERVTERYTRVRSTVTNIPRSGM